MTERAIRNGPSRRDGGDRGGDLEAITAPTMIAEDCPALARTILRDHAGLTTRPLDGDRTIVL